MALIKKSGVPNQSVPAKDDQTNRSLGNLGTSNVDATRSPEGTKRNLSQMPTLKAGTILQDRYTVENVIGVGGMSVVYRGRDMRFRDVARHCAIKEMYQSSPDSSTRLLSLKNFEREAGLLATLTHPAIPKVYDFFEEAGRIYLILELIPGQDLESLIDRSTEPFNEDKVASWAIQICDVLKYLHGHEPEPIIFRDLKPSNMILTTDNRIILIDFGIARIFNKGDRKGTMIGTEGYSPPEQYRGIAEPRGDIYALGATMHHLLTKSDPRIETPFTFHERPIRQLNPNVSPEMEAIVMKAIEYDMADRWESSDDLKDVLLTIAGAAGTIPHTSGAAPRPAVRVGKSKEATTELLWSFKCEDEVRSSPCVRDGLLYIGCYDTNLYAIDAKTGEFRWKQATEGGISSSPAIWSDIVIVGSEDQSVHAFDAKRGSPRWVFRTSKPVRSSPKVEDRIIYIGSDDQHVYAIDGQNGRMLWKYRTWMPVRSSAAIGNGAVIIGSGDGHIYCLDAFQGGLKWKQRTQQQVISTPVIGEGFVYVGSADNNIYALDLEGGWPVWRYRTNHIVNASPAVVGNRVFVGSVDGTFYALDSRGGKVIWKYEVGAQITSSARVDQGRVYFGGTDGTMYALDAGSGQLIWKFACNGPIVSSPAIVDGVVFVGSLDHQVYALRA